MSNCKHCKHSLFDILWGEYKCEVHERILYILLDADECPNFDPKTNNEQRIAKRHSDYRDDEEFA